MRVRLRPGLVGVSVKAVSKTRCRDFTHAHDIPHDIDRDVLGQYGQGHPGARTVSAIRRPATAVMLATTIGIVVPLAVDRGQVDVETGAQNPSGPAP